MWILWPFHLGRFDRVSGRSGVEIPTNPTHGWGDRWTVSECKEATLVVSAVRNVVFLSNTIHTPSRNHPYTVYHAKTIQKPSPIYQKWGVQPSSMVGRLWLVGSIPVSSRPDPCRRRPRTGQKSAALLELFRVGHPIFCCRSNTSQYQPTSGEKQNTKKSMNQQPMSWTSCHIHQFAQPKHRAALGAQFHHPWSKAKTSFLPSGVTTFLFPSDLAIKIRCHELGQDRHGESSWIWVETSHAFRCFFFGRMIQWNNMIV